MSNLMLRFRKASSLLPRYRGINSFLATINHFPTLPERSPNIALASVPKWEVWSRSYGTHSTNSSTFYTVNTSGQYVGYQRHITEITNLATCRDIVDWGCDIQDVQGLSFSQAPLEDFSSLDHMTEARSAPYIHPLSEQNLRDNRNHGEIRILHKADGGGDFFVQYLWDDGRIYLANSGGSHHFATARYIASRIGKAVPLRGRLYTYSLNPESVYCLLRNYRIFILEQQATDDLHEWMCACRVEYGSYALPNPFRSYRAIFLPADKQSSTDVAEMMYDTGIFSLNDYFSKKIGLMYSGSSCAISALPVPVPPARIPQAVPDVHLATAMKPITGQ